MFMKKIAVIMLYLLFFFGVSAYADKPGILITSDKEIYSLSEEACFRVTLHASLVKENLKASFPSENNPVELRKLSKTLYEYKTGKLESAGEKILRVQIFKKSNEQQIRCLEKDRNLVLSLIGEFTVIMQHYPHLRCIIMRIIAELSKEFEKIENRLEFLKKPIAEAFKIITVENSSDTEAPVFIPLADIEVEASGVETSISLPVPVVTDNTDQNPVVICDAPSKFPLGVTSVTWTAKDTSGNTSTLTIKVTVKDTTPPSIKSIANITVEATGPLTNVILPVPEVSDLVDPNPVVTVNAPEHFILGSTTVTVTAKDYSNNTVSLSYVVNIVDTTPPVFSGLKDVSLGATAPFTPVDFSGITATDLVDGNVSVTSDAPSNGFPVGTTEVHFSAKDLSNNIRNASIQVTVSDNTAPITTHDYNSAEEWNRGSVTVHFQATDNASGVKATYYTINNGPETTGNTLELSSDGVYDIAYQSEDMAGNREVLKNLTIKIDAAPPTLTGSINPQPNDKGWNNADAEVVFTANDVLSGVESVSPPITVTTEGKGQVITGIAKDKAGNEASVSVTVNLDKTAPEWVNISPSGGTSVNTLRPEISGQFSDLVSEIDSSSLILLMDEVHIQGDLTVDSGFFSFTPAQDLSSGNHTVSATIKDNAGNLSAAITSVFTIQIGEILPPDPASIAPELDKTQINDVFSSTTFLYTGSNPIQTGVAEGTIVPKQAAVVKGRVLKNDGTPLGGVKITILDHPELGQTLSREDGRFDMVVNGGGLLIIDYQKMGYIPSQRQEEVPWQDYTLIEDVFLLSYDSNVTTIDLNASSPIQVARGSVITDQDGSRQATLLFPQGLTAQLEMQDGSQQAVSTLNIRATEYTVGENGPKAMPAKLPPTSAYTYCVELSADEAITNNAKSLMFNAPISCYVENFIGFNIGSHVPSGYYDRDKGVWIPSDDGRVIKILGLNNGLADIDIDGSGAGATADQLATLGITEAERQSLSSLYVQGTSLWRVMISHFSPHDFNNPYGFSGDAKGSETDDPTSNQDERNIVCKTIGRSIIEPQNQTLMENIPINGTPFKLNYSSSRVPGRLPYIDIPVSNDEIPSSLAKICVTVNVAGKGYKKEIDPQSNYHHMFTWDRKDSFGRIMSGSTQATVKIGYTYPLVYYQSQDELDRSFTNISNRDYTFSRPSNINYGTIWDTKTVEIRSKPPLISQFGNWSLDVVQFYDPVSKITFLGNGARIADRKSEGVLFSVAGNGYWGYYGDEEKATDASLADPKDIVILSDGSLLIADTENNVIRKINSQGTITTFAGNWSSGYGGGSSDIGDGGNALDATLKEPSSIAVSYDGKIYFSDTGHHRIRCIDKNGIIQTIAGTGNPGAFGDGGLAVEAELNDPHGIACSIDGSIYVADSGNNKIRRITTDGRIYTLAGNGTNAFSGDNGFAPDAGLNYPLDVAVDSSGNVYICDTSNLRIRKVDCSGSITSIAGNGTFTNSGDGGKSKNAGLSFPTSISVDLNGNVYIGTYSSIRMLKPDGYIATIVGGGINLNYNFSNGISANQFDVSPQGLAYGPDGLYICSSSRVIRLGTMNPYFTGGQYSLVSENGNELYEFDSRGKHIRTIDVLTGSTKYNFEYNPSGYLIGVQDQNGNLTSIERNSSGDPTAIISPYGQKTELIINNEGDLEKVIDPAGRTYEMTYWDGSLLKRFIKPKGNYSEFTYDSTGRLIKDADSAGGFLELNRNVSGKKFEITETSSEGRTSIYYIEDLKTGETLTKMNGCSGKATKVALLGADESDKINYPDGREVMIINGPDPRFGIQVPVLNELTVKNPSGLTFRVNETREVDLQDPENPLSVNTYTDYLNINGNIYTTYYDYSAKTVTKTSPCGRQVVSTLDTLGRVIREEVPGIEPVNYSYDIQGRIERITQGQRVSRVEYNAQGYVENYYDPENQKTVFESDLLGQITKMNLPDTNSISFGYDLNGNVTSVIPPGKPEHGFTYTSLDLEETYILPNTGSGNTQTRYEYNQDKDITKVVRPDGKEINFSYNARGDLQTITSPSGSITCTYDSQKLYLTGVETDSGERVDYIKDGFLMTEERWNGLVNGRVNWTYDNAFRAVSQSVNGGSTINYQYDADGLLIKAGDETINRNYQNGMIKGKSLGNVTDSIIYNTFGEIENHQTKYNGANLYTCVFERDNKGRITQKTETIDGVTAVYGYSYDAADRLAQVTKDGLLTSSYTFDANGNRLTASNITLIPVYDTQDRLMNYGDYAYTYTANGELQTKTNSQTSETTTYGYDEFGNLKSVSIPDGRIIEYVVDGLSRRIGKRVNGVLAQTWIYENSLKPVAELDSGGNVMARFVYATSGICPDYMVKGGVTYRIITDHLGSPRLVVNSVTGAVVQKIDYSEFGEVIFDTNPGFQPFGFAGGIYDTDTGLTRFGVRDYDAYTGRWTCKDPIKFHGGDMNLYGYCLSNPVNKRDPLGLWGITIGFEGSAAAIGFGGTSGIYSNFSHDPSKPWYSGWSSSVTVVLGGGAAASAYGLSGGVHASLNDSCNVKQLDGSFVNGGRMGLGAFSIEGYRSPDGSVSGAGVVVGPGIGYIGAFAGGTYTWTLAGGDWGDT